MPKSDANFDRKPLQYALNTVPVYFAIWFVTEVALKSCVQIIPCQIGYHFFLTISES